MVATAAAFLCVAGGTVAAMFLIAMLWMLSPSKVMRFLWIPWLALVWIAALLGALALLGYGVAVLTQGSASLSAVFFYTGFLITFTVSVGAAPRLLMLRYAPVFGSVRTHYLSMTLLVTYVALVFLWVPGTLMAALTPLLVMLLTTGGVLWSRRYTHVINNPTPHARPTPHKDVLFWALLIFSALGPLADWALCLAGARDYLLPLFIAGHVLAVATYLYALPTH
jgi:hypothetical protein